MPDSPAPEVAHFARNPEAVRNALAVERRAVRDARRRASAAAAQVAELTRENEALRAALQHAERPWRPLGAVRRRRIARIRGRA